MNPGSIRKYILSGLEDRWPSYVKRKVTSTFTKQIVKRLYRLLFRIETIAYNFRYPYEPRASTKKCLYASAVGRAGKENLGKLIRSFGHETFDYLIFVYDDAQFNEQIFSRCRFIYEKGLKWYFGKKYLTPDYCKDYAYIFFWDDDIDIQNFSSTHFLEIMARNNLQVAQPALSKDSYYSLRITLAKERYKVGKYTDYVEIMVPVFTTDAWIRFWGIIEPDYNYWGWGYDALARSLCRYKNMGIVHCETVRHVRPIQSRYTCAPADMNILFQKHKKYRRAKRVAYAKLK